MQKCQYILENDLPPTADENEIKHVKVACELDKARLGQSARSYSANRWRVHESQLRGAIIKHISEKKRVFRKYATGTRSLIPNRVQANVTLFEELDIYVEVALMQHEAVIIYAHDHDPSMRRLPQ